MLADYEGMLSDGEAQRVLLAIYNKANETDNLDVYILDPNNKLTGGGFQMVGQVNENLLSDEEVREVNMLGDRFRRGNLQPEEVDRYRELLEDGGVVIREGGEAGIPTYDIPIVIGLTNKTNQKRLLVNLHIMESNGRYDAFLHKKAEAGDASFMQSRAFIQEIYQFLEEIK